MQNNMFRYYNTNSFIHKLSPITKTLILFIFTITLFIPSGIIPILMLIILETIYLLISNIPFELHLKHLKIESIFLITILLMLIILKFELMIIFIIMLKLIQFIIMFNLLILTTTNNDINYGLCKILPFDNLNNKISLILLKFSNFFEQYYKIDDEVRNRNVNMSFFNKINLSLKHTIYNNDRIEEMIYLNKNGLKKSFNKFDIINLLFLLIFILIFIIIFVKEVII